MKVNEIFLSIQGESLSAGFPTIFVRLTGCNLRCSYCDTAYAYHEGREMSPQEILLEIQKLHYKRICLTGGEPLLQDETACLLKLLKDFTVTVETNGSVALDTDIMQAGHSFVMDMKVPSSGCSLYMLFENFDWLRDFDEIKFVVGDRNDYEWSKSVINEYYKRGIISFSPVFGKTPYAEIVKWILEDRLDARFQLQLHKLIWDPGKRGV